jgi:hypothetical protein
MQQPAPNDPKQVGHYRVVALLGSGGMGRVYLGLDPSGFPAAVKVVRAEYAYDPGFRERFARELELAQRVYGNYTPRVLSADTSGQTPWLATEYVMGPSLQDLVQDTGALPEDSVRFMGRGIAQALERVHATGLVHRDLKPGNVLLSRAGPRVIDFGIARAVEGTALTRTGGVVGTAGWTSPEQYRGEAVTDRTDLFTWGALVAYAARGRAPFGEAGSDVVAGRILSAAPDLDGLSEDLRAVVAAALDKDPAGRPSSREAAHAVCAIADPAVRGGASRLLATGWTAPDHGHRPEEWLRHAPRRRAWPRRHPVRAAAAAALAVALVTGVAWWAADGPAPLRGDDDPAAETADAANPADEAESAPAAARVPDEQEVPEEYQPYIESGYVEVRTEPASRATLVGRLNPPDYLGSDAEAMDRLAVHLLAVRPDGDGVEVVVGLEYLLDFAAVVVDAEDFLLGSRWFAHGEDELPRMDTRTPANTTDVQVSAEEPLAELTVAFDDAPAQGVLVYYPPEVVQERYDDPGLAPEAATGYCYDVESEDGPFPESPGFTEHDPESSCLPAP